MPHSARLRKVGGSVMLAIPKPMLDALDLAPDSSVGLSIKAGRLVVDPQKATLLFARRVARAMQPVGAALT